MSLLGRPRTLDEMKRREICALVSAGDGLPQAARYVGCSVKTIRREAERNDEFADALRQAELSARLAPLQAMRKAAQTHWRAAAWMLERTNPERFGRKRPNSLGRKELRVLARDLRAIVEEEVADPIDRERLSRRFKATINYAMRHAWDDRRTGVQLRQAMEYFDAKQAAPDAWLSEEFADVEPHGEPWDEPHDEPRQETVAESATQERDAAETVESVTEADAADEETQKITRALWSCWTKVREQCRREREKTLGFAGSPRSRREIAADFCPEKCAGENGTKGSEGDEETGFRGRGNGRNDE